MGNWGHTAAKPAQPAQPDPVVAPTFRASDVVLDPVMQNLLYDN